MMDNLYHSDPEQLATSMARLKDLPVSVIHGGPFLDEYLAGGRRITDADNWLTGAAPGSELL